MQRKFPICRFSTSPPPPAICREFVASVFTIFTPAADFTFESKRIQLVINKARVDPDAQTRPSSLSQPRVTIKFIKARGQLWLRLGLRLRLKAALRSAAHVWHLGNNKAIQGNHLQSGRAKGRGGRGSGSGSAAFEVRLLNAANHWRSATSCKLVARR